MIALYPLAVACAAIAVVALRTKVLPRRLAGSAVVTALALAVNGAFLEASFVPALLLVIAWTFLTSIHLLRATRTTGRRVVGVQTAAGN